MNQKKQLQCEAVEQMKFQIARLEARIAQIRRAEQERARRSRQMLDVVVCPECGDFETVAELIRRVGATCPTCLHEMVEIEECELEDEEES